MPCPHGGGTVDATERLERLPPETIRRLTDFVTAAPYLTRGRYDSRIAAHVAEAAVLDGACALTTKGLARRFGSNRQTMCKAIRRLIAARVICIVGEQADKRRLYAPCLERGDEWRRDFERRQP